MYIHVVHLRNIWVCNVNYKCNGHMKTDLRFYGMDQKREKNVQNNFVLSSFFSLKN